MGYIMIFLERDMIHEETRAMRFFKCNAPCVCQQVMASIIYAEIAWYQFKIKIFPNVPMHLQDKPPYPHDASPPRPLSHIKNVFGDEWKTRLQVWWKYFMALIQYWTDAGSSHLYGGPVRDDRESITYTSVQRDSSPSGKFHSTSTQ